MVLKIVANLDFEPSESAIDRAISYVEGLLNKSGDLFKIVSDPSRMDKVRAKVIEILVVGSVAKRNPARRSDESPLYVKYLSLKSDEEPFMMQGSKYEYVWAEYPGGIKDIGVYSYANDLVYSYDSFRQMMNLDRANPVKPRKGEKTKAFVSRCMSEEKASFPEPKQRIAVCLSKSRKRNPVYDTGSDE